MPRAPPLTRTPNLKTITPIFFNNSNPRRWWHEIGFTPNIKHTHRKTMEKAFTTWTHKKVRFLAVTRDRGEIAVMDETGTNYGAYQSLDSFREAQRMESRIAEPIGKARAAIIPQ